MTAQPFSTRLPSSETLQHDRGGANLIRRRYE